MKDLLSKEQYCYKIDNPYTTTERQCTSFPSIYNPSCIIYPPTPQPLFYKKILIHLVLVSLAEAYLDPSWNFTIELFVQMVING